MAAPMEKADTSCSATFARLNEWENINDMDDIRAEIEFITSQELKINEELDGLLNEQTSLEMQLSSLHKQMPNLSVIRNDATQLTGMISFTSDLAENVSSKVRQLDTAKSRVLATSLRVEDILDLKFCTEGVQQALQEEAYEQAAALIHRFLSMDESILKLSADAAEGSSLRQSFETLHNAEAKLKTIANNKFDAAVNANDAASIERFFKIFPLLGMREEGLKKFAKYLSSTIADKTSEQLVVAESATDARAPVIYADLLGSLFELIAKTLEINQPLVETKYGHGWLLTFVKGIQKECDRQGRRIIDEFTSKRSLNSMVKKIQDGLNPVKSSAATTEKFDPKALDPLLAEITLMNSKCELYHRFIKRRVTTDMENLGKGSVADKQTEIDDLVRRSDLSKEMQLLIGYYIMMEEYYMKEMAHKAAELDKRGDDSYTSSVVDDTFYIIKKGITIDGVCAVINHACALLEEIFIDRLRTKLKLGYPSGALSQAYNLVQSSLQQGKLQSSDVEKARQQFLLTLNNSETSSDNIEYLKCSIESEIPKLLSADTRHTEEKLDSCLGDLGQLTKKFKDIVDFGFDQLKNSAIKSRIKPMMEVLLSTSHNITEDLFSSYEVEDPWVQSFIVDLDAFLQHFKPALTPTNYDKFMSQVTNEITCQMERAVMKITFNRLGGLQFDKELRSLLGYLTNVTTWTIRDRFARLSQMATILNLEKVSEILDYWGSNSGPFTWRLTPSEVRQVLALRVDFSNDEIRQLKL